MHVHAHIEGMHVDARTPSLACLRMRLLVSSTEQLSEFVCLHARVCFEHDSRMS
jgi:hypothetical protein